jgi:hypothetical protein
MVRPVALLHERLRPRRVRVLTQASAFACVVVGVALTTQDNTAVQATGMALVGLVALAAIKLALVVLAAPRVVTQPPVAPVIPAVPEVDRSEIVELREQITRMGEEIGEAPDSHRRAETAVAQVSVLRLELVTLKDQVEEIRRTTAR